MPTLRRLAHTLVANVPEAQRKSCGRLIVAPDAAQVAPKTRFRVPIKGGLAMDVDLPNVCATPEHIAELDRLGDEIALLSAHLNAATARLLDLIRVFDAREGWANGFRSCAAWLSWRVGLDGGAAREKVRVARALGTLPRLAGALAGGELSYSKVRALTRVATPETEERLLAVGRAGTAEHVERIVRGRRRVDRNARCCCGRSKRAARRSTDRSALRTVPRSASSRRTRWPCSPRRRSITDSILARRASATKWWFTSTPECWRTRIRRANRSSKTARTFPPKRPGAWRATRAGS